MGKCTNTDNSDITGRGVLCSFYIQGLLMVTNGLLDIEQRDITPSMITILVICITLLYEVINETSIYLALILHLLLCFHVLASHAVIVWVAVKDNGGMTANNWNSRYHIIQLAGFVVLAASGYFGLVLKKCDLGILGFFATKSFSIESFAPLAVLPYIFSAFVTLFLKEGSPTETPHNRRHYCYFPRSSVHAVLVVVWILSLIFMITILESTLRGNRNQIGRPPNASGGWTFGQILPLVLNIPPVWLFTKHVFMRFKDSNFKASALNAFNILKSPILSETGVVSNDEEDPIELRDVVLHSNSPPNGTVEDTNRPDHQLIGDPPTAEHLVPPENVSMFVGSRQFTISGGQFLANDAATLRPKANLRPSRAYDGGNETT